MLVALARLGEVAGIEAPNPAVAVQTAGGAARCQWDLRSLMAGWGSLEGERSGAAGGACRNAMQLRSELKRKWGQDRGSGEDGREEVKEGCSGLRKNEGKARARRSGWRVRASIMLRPSCRCRSSPSRQVPVVSCADCRVKDARKCQGQLQRCIPAQRAQRARPTHTHHSTW